MAPRYRVTLTQEARQELESIATQGKGRPGRGCLPGPCSDRMREKRALYPKPYDPKYPVVCLDESSWLLMGEGPEAHARRPGSPGVEG